MANLTSPGVSVSIIDDSIYAAQGQGTVPFVAIATAQDKTTPDGSELATGTSLSTAGKVHLITSQRELLQTFGDPVFQSAGGTAIHGSPLNEYGLLAAHSYLGLANRAYIVRADIDLAELEGTSVAPSGDLDEGIYWLDSDDTDYGLSELVEDPNNPANVVWSPVEMDYVFINAVNDTIGENGEHAMLVNDEPYNNETVLSVSYHYKENGAWVLLRFGSYDAGAQAARLIAGSVYPVNDAQGNALTTNNIGTSYWLKTSGNLSANLKFRVSDGNGSFVDATIINVLFDTDVETSHANASLAYGNLLTDGVLYSQIRFSSDTTGGAGDGFSDTHIYRYSNGEWLPVNGVSTDTTAPVSDPIDGTYWYNPDVGLNSNGQSTVDLLVNNGTGSWENIIAPGHGAGDYTGSISSVQFFNQSLNPIEAGATLVHGDVWLDSADLVNYPSMFKWVVNKWIAIDKSDQTTPSGIVFGDARGRPDYNFDDADITQGVNNGLNNAPDLDLDAPDPDAYPAGMLLWNTRYSSMGVRQIATEQLVAIDNNGVEIIRARWNTVSGNKSDGSPYMGIDAQKVVVTRAVNAVIVSNDDLRSESLTFNLLAAPGFPECIDELVSLNIDRKETGFVIGDSPFGLSADATSLQAWATNANSADGNGDDGLTTASPYLGVYYPSGLSTNVDGSEVVVPSSHMALRVFGYNDQAAYQWFAPAGTQRGVVSNASSVGYLDDEGEYVAVTLNQGQRDTLYSANVNAIATIPGSGPVIYGQKTRSATTSAMDRVNVARLVNYIRTQADVMARPYLFEQNDTITRANVKEIFERFMGELISLRAITDYLVVVDDSNNTGARIDKNELWISLAVQPTKSVEFIYIPIRIVNTGEL